MTNTQAAALIVGLAMPFIISIVKQVGLNKWANLAIAAVTCAGAGVLTAWATGQFITANVIGSVAAVFVAAQATYVAYWQGTEAEETLNELTSVIK